jgi:hypothetical protein
MAGNDQPGRCRRGVSIGQNVDDAPPLQITDDRSVAMAALPGKVVDPDDARILRWLDSTTSHDT